MDQPIQLRTRLCPICGHANEQTPPGPYSRPPWSIIDCAGCGFAHVRVVPETEELVENLAWDKTYATEQKRRVRENPVISWLDAKTRWRLGLFPRTEPVDIMNRLGAAGPVIDLGCGSGGHLANLAKRFTPYGVEISSALAARAEQATVGRGGQIVQNSAKDGLAGFPDAFFAGALLRSYLEHDSDAREVMLELGRKLRPDGLVIIKVPNYGSINRRVMGRNWCGIRLPDHVNYFTRASLTSLAGDAGFGIEFPFMLSLPTDDNVVCILRKK